MLPWLSKFFTSWFASLHCFREKLHILAHKTAILSLILISQGKITDKAGKIQMKMFKKEKLAPQVIFLNSYYKNTDVYYSLTWVLRF
jgi:hypothetical protein